MKSHLAAFVAALIAASLAMPAAAQQPLPSMRRDLQRHNLSVPNHEVYQAEVSLKPGVLFPRHSHPGEEVIYVLKGTWVYELDGQRPVTVKAGEVLFIPDGVVHSARNIGTDVGIELATYILRKGEPLLKIAK
jgi:quercetin dioxygenase-like cupin family protein